MKRPLLLIGQLLFSAVLMAQNTIYPSSLTVAQDGSGSFKTIQEAVNSIRDLGQARVVIHIKKGVYHEKLIIPSWKTNVSLIGDDKDNTIITNDDFSGKPNPCGRDAFGKDKFTTYTSYTVLVQGNGFIAKNLTIGNTAGRVGQAVALHAEGDRCIFINCRLLGNQDTLYAATENSRQFYKDCDIEGTTDFIFGEATAVFENCVIKSLANSYITAAATTSRQQFGFVFFNCRLIAAAGVDKVYLGRPWRPYAKTVFIRTAMGDHILPQGWNPWKGDAMFPDKEKTAFYGEFENNGAGSNISGRVSWSHRLTAADMKNYTLKNILGGKDGWDPTIN